MKIFPAIDLFGGQAVRLYKGDYDQMTVYDPEPLNTVRKFEAAGASCLHLVDLEGAKTGQTTNLPTIEKLAKSTGLFIEVGGGIRTMDTVRRYLDAGAGRVILGTAAVTDPDFFFSAARAHPGRIAAGVDVRDGFVAIRGWREQSALTLYDFCARLLDSEVRAVIRTDIALYVGLHQRIQIVDDDAAFTHQRHNRLVFRND